MSRPADTLYPERPLDGRLLAALDALSRIPPAELLVTDGSSTRAFTSPFTAALVASALAHLPPPTVEPLLRRQVRSLVGGQRDAAHAAEDGWRFSDDLEPILPVDLDDTACALAALAEAGAPTVGPAVLKRRLERWLEHFPRNGDGFATWYLGEAERLPGRTNDVDVVVNVNLLHAAALMRLPLPEVADYVTGYVGRHGLDCAPGSLYYRSPFGFAYFLARWLETAQTVGQDPFPELRERVAGELAERAASPPAQPLDLAFHLAAVIRLGVQDRSLHRLADRLLEAGSDTGLWPAAPLFVDPAGAVYGSIQVTTAVAVEALYRYSRAGLSLYRTARHCSTAPRARPGTLEDTLQPFEDVVPPTLVARESFAHLRHICRLFPSALTSGFGMECRLAEPEPRADLLLCINAEGHGRDVLAGVHPEHALPEGFWERREWRRIRRYCRDWAQSESLSHRLVADFWLEFDLDRPPDDVPVPSVFFCTPPPAEGELEHYPQLIADSLETLWGDPLGGGVRANLDRCFAALPDGAYPFAVGAMLSRSLQAARYCVKDLAPQALVDYLRRLGWPGDLPALERWLGRLADRIDRIHLDLDVGDEIYPGLGLECSFDGRRQPYEEPRWQALLDDLVEAGLCTADKRRALLAWSGPFTCRQNMAGETWVSCFDNKLSHVKLGLDGEGRVEVKAYIGSWRHYGNRVVAPPEADATVTPPAAP